MMSENRIDADKNIPVSTFAKWLETDEKTARAKAEECEAIREDGYIMLDVIDKKTGTHYVELGCFGADSIPDWMQPMLRGQRLFGH